MRRYIWILGLPFMMAQSPIPSSFPIKFQARFTPLSASVAKARLEESGRIVVPDLTVATPCGADKCVLFTIPGTPGQTLRFKIVVANTAGQEVASNEATFSVPAPPTAPTLSMSVAP